MKRAVVTGGMGFIGGALVRRLVQEGYDVTVMDIMLDQNLRMLDTGFSGRCAFVASDCRLEQSWDSLEGEFDVVFHYAAHYANVRSLEEPMENVSINMLGTMAALRFCRARKVPNMVYASSSGVYGSVDGAAYAENNPPRPATPYEVTKYSGELLSEGWCNVYGIGLVAPRYFNVYGPGDVPGKWRAVVPNFIRKALHGEEIVITGAKASRDFTFIDDAVSLTLAGLKRVSGAPSPIQLIYNVGTGHEVFIKHLADTIVKMYGSASKIVMGEFRYWDNAPRRVADCHKVQALFPDVFAKMRRIEDGLNLSRGWYKGVCESEP